MTECQHKYQVSFRFIILCCHDICSNNFTVPSLGKNPNLYSFDLVKQFLADKEENIDSTNLALNLFVAFAEDKDEQSLGNIPLSIVLQEWNATSKCNEIILAQEDKTGASAQSIQ